MSITTDPTITKLVRIAEAVALKQCEAVEHGQEPCPLQYDDQGECCLSCQARKAAEQYINSKWALSRRLS